MNKISIDLDDIIRRDGDPHFVKDATAAAMDVAAMSGVRQTLDQIRELTKPRVALADAMQPVSVTAGIDQVTETLRAQVIGKDQIDDIMAQFRGTPLGQDDVDRLMEPFRGSSLVKEELERMRFGADVLDGMTPADYLRGLHPEPRIDMSALLNVGPAVWDTAALSMLPDAVADVEWPIPDGFVDYLADSLLDVDGVDEEEAVEVAGVLARSALLLRAVDSWIFTITVYVAGVDKPVQKSLMNRETARAVELLAAEMSGLALSYYIADAATLGLGTATDLAIRAAAAALVYARIGMIRLGLPDPSEPEDGQ